MRHSACSIVIYDDDPPALIATKAFRMQAKREVHSEDDLERKLKKF